jgi:hypothetical protein
MITARRTNFRETAEVIELKIKTARLYLVLGWGGFPLAGKIAPMNKESRPPKNLIISVIHLLDVIAAGAAALICVGVGAVCVGRWLLGG